MKHYIDLFQLCIIEWTIRIHGILTMDNVLKKSIIEYKKKTYLLYTFENKNDFACNYK